MVDFLFLLNKEHKIRKLFFFVENKSMKWGIILENYFVSMEFKILLLFLQKIN